MLGLEIGRPSSVIAPQAKLFAASISALEKPSAPRRSKPGAS